MIKAGVIGGAGYTAGELLRLLINHPEVQIEFVHSTSNAGNWVWEVHGGLIGECDIKFASEYDLGAVDVLFLCSAHGQSRGFMESAQIPEGVKVIDLAQDFRDESCGFVYGLPEMQSDRIKGATRVANPGCFATAIQLAMLPLVAAGELKSEVHITALTGSTGAGVKPSTTTHFSWRCDNISAYKAFEHQHLIEIGRNVKRLDQGFDQQINFVPLRGDFTRGIFVSMYIDTELSQEQAQKIYEEYYAGAHYTHYTQKSVDLKQVVNTNKCVVGVKKYGSKLHVISVIDNLLKGASGQAVENMNLMFGFEPTLGLRLKPSAF